MAARTILPRLTARAPSRFLIPSSRSFHRSPLVQNVVSGAEVSEFGPGTRDMSPATQVPVITYNDGQRSVEQITVSQPVTPTGADVQHAASALKRELTSQMTPTMKKFTLHGKVAVVTGYAYCCP